MSATIYELASKAGVSISTVSKALNDSYSISEKTKQRIREMAEEMGYLPNARARSFAFINPLNSKQTHELSLRYPAGGAANSQ